MNGETSEFRQLVLDSLNLHQKCPEIDLNTYRRIKRVSLACEVRSTHRLYLDTNYWVNLREVELGRCKNASYTELLKSLKELAEQGRVSCPLSYSSFAELLHQSDAQTRITTAQLMDRLSKATCLHPPHYLMAIELECLLRRTLFPNEEVYEPLDLAWTKAAYWLGECTPKLHGFPPDAQLLAQKSFEDVLWSQRVVDLVRDGVPNRTAAREDYKRLAVKLNQLKLRRENVHGKYEDTFQSEVGGILDANQEMLDDVMHRICQAYGFNYEVDSDSRRVAAKGLRSLVANAYECGRLSTDLPQIHIIASLHAAVRHDQGRKYRTNDFEDFRHAGGALPYCDTFLAERALKHLICTRPLELDRVYDTRVISEPMEAVAFVRDLS